MVITRMDEPVSGLDPKVTQEMYQLIADLNKDGIAIVMISHDIAQAVRYASHILHIGERIFYCSTADYLMSAPGRLFVPQMKGGMREWQRP